MSKKILIIFIFVLLVAVVVAFFALKNGGKRESVSNFDECVAAGNPVMESYPRVCRSKDGKFFTEQVTPSPDEDDKSEFIRIINPHPNEVITSPYTIIGEARGSWFFEASFSGELIDGNGNSLAVFIAEAEEDWMTEEFVPFTATLSFSSPVTENGTLIFKKSNPSGLPEHDDEFRLPIQFVRSADSVPLEVFFSSISRPGSITPCEDVYAVIRSVPKTSTPLRAVIMELLKGPTEEEKSRGYSTNINSGVTLQRAIIQDGTAYLDFDDTLQNPGGGSCRVLAIRSQIEMTAKQFDSVKNVVISINGRTEDILQP